MIFEVAVSMRKFSFILDLYTPLPLDDAPVPDLLPNFWTSPDTSGILRVPECTQNTWTRVQGRHST